MKITKKVPWGLIAALCIIVAVLLTAAVICCGYIMNAIASQTNNTAGIFDTWWQVLIFVIDLIAIPTAVISLIFYYKSGRQKESVGRSTILKIFSKSVFGISTGLFAIFFIACMVGESLTLNNSSFINEFLGIKEYEVVQSDTDEIFNEYKSDYVNVDGTFNDKAMRNNSLAVALQTATEGTVLLSNKNDALPLDKNSKISFFGISTVKYIFSGAGSGQLAVNVTTSLSEECKNNGLIVNPKLANAYKMLSAKYGHYQTGLGSTLSGASAGDHCYVEYGINEAPWSEINKTSVGNVSSTFAEYGDAAIMIISRNDGEDGDTNYYTSECVDGNYLDLANEEIKILDELMSLKQAGTFKKVVLVINSASPMQMKHISGYDLDACLWVGIGGSVSFTQIAEVLSGKENPSGKLIDTYVYDNYSAPSSVNIGDFTYATTDGLPATETYVHNDKYVMYSEGIYVGYRYYETRYEDVVLKKTNVGDYDYSAVVKYPFGFGMSYTRFERTGFTVKKVKGGYEITTTVKNVGSKQGKEVVQAYIQKPYTDYDVQTGIEKASVELVGYAKTKLLDSGESQTLTIFVDDKNFASYDAYGHKTYIVEAGEYYLAVGDDCHDALNNILAAKGKTVSDGMDKEGKSQFAEKITIGDTDTTTYSKSATGHTVTNSFNDADPTLYEGTKEQFGHFRYLSRSNWTGTYPTKAIIDCVTQRMRDDLQYAQAVKEIANSKMPSFGKSGAVKLMDLWGRDYDDAMWDSLLDQITWEEAVALVTTGGGTGGCVSAGAPGGKAKDGPGGIGVANADLSDIMCFPSECVMAATFNDQLIELLGNAFGMEILHVGYTGIYGPGANIHRSAFSGRNWEYYSEDPFISGKTLVAEVKGLQNRGVIVFTKHFLLNDEERNRYGICVWANEQSIREIYLKPFEYGVTEGNMNGIMTSFNRIGAIWSGKHVGLLTEVLHNEWGFKGVVQTDAYVATYMHRALAESIVAGNDFTMGGANVRALDAFTDNATVAQALRDCCHRILYTQLHSNAVNGLSMNYKIVYVTPWWKTAINVVRIVSLVLMIICFVMFVVSCFVNYAVKKKRYIEASRSLSMTEQTPVKVKYFFDVFSKPFTIITSVILVLVIAASAVIPTALLTNNNTANVNSGAAKHVCTSVCEVCGGCKNADCKDPACADKCTCGQRCEHACPVCGLCVDENSTDPRCAKKCGGDKKHELVFEAEDDHVYRFAGNLERLFVAKEEGATADYVGGLNANVGAVVKFVLEAEEEGTVSLVVSVSKRNSALLFTNSMLVTVNDDIIESKAIVPSISDGEPDWVTFVDVNLGCVNLKAGRNVIKFTVADSQNGTGFNFDSIKLKSDIAVSWYEGDHVCDDVCPTCGLCRNELCEDPACANKCLCDLNVQEFDVSDGKAIIEGAEQTAGIVKFNSLGQKVTYNIKSDDLVKAILFLNISTETDITANFLFEIRVNGEEIASAFSQVPNGQPDKVKIGSIKLPFGHNKIEITALTDIEVLFGGIVLGCDDDLYYADENEFLTTEGHVGITGNAYKSVNNYVVSGGAEGATITFPIYSDRDGQAELIIELSYDATENLSDTITVKVNGFDITVPSAVDDGEKDKFVKVSLGNINVKSGHNEITVSTVPLKTINLRGISFANTSAKLLWSDMGFNSLKVEAESTTLLKADYDGKGVPSVGGGFNASDGAYVGGINEAGLYCPREAGLKFTVSASISGKAYLYFGMGVSGTARGSSYTVFVNGRQYDSDMFFGGNGWYDWKSHFFCIIDLDEGQNTVEVRINDGDCVNFDYFIIEGFTVIA